MDESAGTGLNISLGVIFILEHEEIVKSGSEWHHAGRTQRLKDHT